LDGAVTCGTLKHSGGHVARSRLTYGNRFLISDLHLVYNAKIYKPTFVSFWLGLDDNFTWLE